MNHLPQSLLFVSDAHAHPEALRAVLALAESVGPITKRIFLGDAIGYGNNPKEVLDILRDFDVCIRGNHEALVLGQESRWEYSRTAVKSLDRHVKMLQEDDIAFLKSFVTTYRVGGILAYHGTPDSVSNYPFNEIDIRDLLNRFSDADFMIGGHLHIPRLAIMARGTGRLEFEEPIPPISIHELDFRQYRYFVNCPSATPGRFGYDKPGAVRLEMESPEDARLQFLFVETELGKK